MKAVLIPGDGIGREIAESVREVSAALNTGIEWQEFAAGAEYAAESGELIAPGTLDAIEACGWALKGPTATPIGKGFRSINVQLRQRFSTYANLRPVHTLPGVPTRFDNVDLVIVRENTEDRSQHLRLLRSLLHFLLWVVGQCIPATMLVSF